MAFDSDGLRVLGRNDTGGLVLWSYETRDAWRDLLQPRYFNRSCGLRPGDLIFASSVGHETVTGILAAVSVLPGDVVVAQLVAPVAYDASVEAA